ncbi:MAG: type I methionyl aminopeptidase [Phycisphaerae bacterium]
MKRLPSLFRRPTGRRISRPVLKSAREIALMRQAGRVVARVLDHVGELVKPGVATSELNRVAERIIDEAGGQALFKGVKSSGTKFPFPAALCISVNDEVVHGMPSDQPLNAGDIVSVDCGVRLKGYCGDSARTFAVGSVSAETRRLLDVTAEALDAAIAATKPDRRWSEVAREIQGIVESAGFSVVRDFVGHGIGTDMHEEPKVPNFTDRQQRKKDFVLQPGLVLAIEPMVNAGQPDVDCRDPSGWTQTTKDGSRSAHFEHSVAVTADGADVLTDGR